MIETSKEGLINDINNQKRHYSW